MSENSQHIEGNKESLSEGHNEVVQNPNLREVKHYTQISEEVRKLIEGVPYSELPDNFLSDSIIDESIAEIQTQEFEWREATAKRKEDLYQRLTSYYQAHPEDPSAQAHLLNKPRMPAREFSQQTYLLNDKVFRGQVHRGEQYRTLPINKLDGIDDVATIVYIHNHPNALPVSRTDFRILLSNKPNFPSHALFPIICGDDIFVLIPCLDSERDDETIVKDLRILPDTEKLEGIPMVERDEMLTSLNLPPSTTREKITFAMTTLDVIRCAEKTRSGIYHKKIEQDSFSRLKTIEDVHQLLAQASQ